MMSPNGWRFWPPPAQKTTRSSVLPSAWRACGAPWPTANSAMQGCPAGRRVAELSNLNKPVGLLWAAHAAIRMQDLGRATTALEDLQPWGCGALRSMPSAPRSRPGLPPWRITGLRPSCVMAMRPVSYVIWGSTLT